MRSFRIKTTLKSIISTYSFAVKSIPSLRIIILLALLIGYISTSFLSDFLSPTLKFEELSVKELFIDKPIKIRKRTDKISFTDSSGVKYVYFREMNNEIFDIIISNKNKLAKIYYTYEHSSPFYKREEIKHLTVDGISIISYNYENELYYKNQYKLTFILLISFMLCMFFFVYVKAKAELFLTS